MKKIASYCLCLCFLLTIFTTGLAEVPTQTLTFIDNPNENIQSLCWIDNTLYMLGNETIYQWRSDTGDPQVYWRQAGIELYRYQETAPDNEAERTLWQRAIRYLVTDGTNLYAWHSYTGQLFTVQEQGLTLAATVPHSILTYDVDGQSVYRELRQVSMRGNQLFLLLGTDDPSDWNKNSLICFDIETEQSSILAMGSIQKFIIANESTLIASFYDEHKYRYTFHQIGIQDGEIQSPFLTFEIDQACGSMGFWQDHLLLCASGQITSYDIVDGSSEVKAYVPVASYNTGEIICNDDGMCAVAIGDYVFLRDLTQKPEMTILHIMGDIDFNVVLNFSLENPDIAIVNVPQTAENLLQQSVLTSSNEVDLYVVDAPGIYEQLKRKGYLAPLNASSLLMNKVETLYPSIQNTIMENDQLFALPINMSTENWTLNQTLWDRFALGCLPKTYDELLDMMELWQDFYADENPDYTLVDLIDGVAGCVKLLVKEYLLQCDDEYPDFTKKEFRNAMLEIIAHQDVLNANAENDGMPIIYTYYQGFGISYNDTEQTRMMLMPSITDDETQRLGGTLKLLAMSSVSTQQEAALRLITYCSDHIEAQTNYMMNFTLNVPLRRENHDEIITALQEERAMLEAQLAVVDDTVAAELKDKITQTEAQITSVEENWLISAESIANYRSIAQKLVIPYNSPFLGNDKGFEALEKVIDTACGQRLDERTLDVLLENLNRVSRLVMLENE